MSIRRIAFLSLAGAALFAVSARAGTVTADFEAPDGIHTIDFDSSFGITAGDSAAILNATRIDTPGAGVDTLLPDTFQSFCVELGQDITVNQDSTFANVIPLSSNPSTDTGGVTGPVTFDPTRTANMDKLFGSFFPSVGDATENDAFQLAIWDIAFNDEILSLVQDPTDPNDRLWVDPANLSSSVATLAQSYLTAIKADEGVNALPEANVVLLTDPILQDQLAVIPGVSSPVPEPATLALLIPAGMMMLRRRSR